LYGKINALNAGEYIKIPKKSVHSVKITSSENMVIIEIQLGEILKESDIERISDIYGRVGE
jgi:Mannose-6-phosphate isomerase